MEKERFWLTDKIYIEITRQELCYEEESIITARCSFTAKSMPLMRVLLNTWPEYAHACRLITDIEPRQFPNREEAIEKSDKPKENIVYFEEKCANYEETVRNAVRSVKKIISGFANDAKDDTIPEVPVKKSGSSYRLVTYFEDPWTKNGEWQPADMEISEKPRHTSLVKSKSVLKSVPINRPIGFIPGSREREFNSLDKIFNEAYANPDKPNVAILKGLDTYGKTTLAKKWICDRMENTINGIHFDSVVFATFDRELKEKRFQTLINSNLFDLTMFSRTDDEDDRRFFNRKINKLCETQPRTTLVVLDDYMHDRDVMNLLDYQRNRFDFSMLIITDEENMDGYPSAPIPVETMDEKYLIRLFRENVSEDYIYCDELYTAEGGNVIRDIIRLAKGQTLLVQVFARHIGDTYDTLQEYYDRLMTSDGHIFKGMTGSVQGEGSWKGKQPLDMMKHRFRISNLEESADKDVLRQLLVFLYSIPVRGIDKKLIIQYLKNIKTHEYAPVLQMLIRRKWVSESAGVVSVNPAIREVIFDTYKKMENGKAYLQLSHCRDIVLRIMDADKDYPDRLYHQTWEEKEKILPLFESMLNVFRYADNKNTDFSFDFYVKMRKNIGSCGKWSRSKELNKEMLAMETDAWREAYLIYQRGKIEIIHNRNKPKGLIDYEFALREMSKPSVDTRKRRECAMLYRDIGTVLCNKIFEDNIDGLSEDTINLPIELFNEGQKLVDELLEEGGTELNLLLYKGTVKVWEAQLKAYKGEDVLTTLKEAEDIFGKYNYVNAVDKSRVIAIRAAVCRKNGDYKQEAKLQKKSNDIYRLHFRNTLRNAERCHILFNALRNSGQWKEALETAKEGLKIVEDLYGNAVNILKSKEHDAYCSFLEKVEKAENNLVS